MYGNHTEFPTIRKNQFCVLRSLELEGNSKPLCGFSSWYIAWLLFSLRLLAKSEVSARTSNKTCLNKLYNAGVTVCVNFDPTLGCSYARYQGAELPACQIQTPKLLTTSFGHVILENNRDAT